MYGIGVMIVGSLYVMAGALVIGVPLGILCAIFLAFFGSRRVAKIAKSGVQLLAGIPSVVYGFFGLVVLVPFIRENLGGTGQSILCASLVLGIMILLPSSPFLNRHLKLFQRLTMRALLL